MYLNESIIWIILLSSTRLTVTLDVFKYIFASGAQNGAFRLTVTLDVFKFS